LRADYVLQADPPQNAIWDDFDWDDFTWDAGYALTGEVVDFQVGLVFKVDPGVYDLSGSDANLVYAQEIDPASGSYLVSSVGANLELGYVLFADPGTPAFWDGFTWDSFTWEGEGYALTGSGVDLSVNFTLPCDPGIYSLAGVDADTRYDRIFHVDGDTYTLVGFPAAVLTTRYMAAAGDSYLISGADANLEYGRKIDPDSGAYETAGTDVEFNRAYRIKGVGEYLIRGFTRGQEWDYTRLRVQRLEGRFDKKLNAFYPGKAQAISIEANRELELDEQDIIDITEIVMRAGVL
jgi:hypothetical protein